MSEKDCILALDVGTSGAKACLISRAGEILAKAQAAYEFKSNCGFVEQDPSDWWRSVLSLIRSIREQNPLVPAALVLSGQMQSLILLKGSEVLTDAVLYVDNRAGKEIEEIYSLYGEENLRKLTGNLNDGSSVLAKLLWLKRNAPDLYREAGQILLGAHDYITWKLCGVSCTDFTNAATTGLLDIKGNVWAEDLLKTLDLRTDWLPQLKASWEQSGGLSSEAAALCGLPAGLPVFHGAGDAASATIGSGAGEPGYSYVYLGTSGWLAATGLNQLVNPLTGIWNLRHPDPQRLILLGPMLTTAGNWEWLKETFAELEPGYAGDETSAYEVLTAQAASSPAGSNGVFYLPMINGERSPVRDPNASGVFFGIRRTTSRGDLYRSVLEGVTYGMLSIREVMREVLPSGLKMQELCLTGGGAKSDLWAQIFADVMDCKVNVLRSPEDVGVKGMAIIAGKALGWYSSYLPAEQLGFEKTFLPGENVSVYRKAYMVYKELYPSLKNVFLRSAQIMS